MVNPTGTAVIYGAPSVISATRTSVSGLNALLSSQSATVSADRYIMRTTDNSVIWQVTATSSFGISIGTAGPNAGGRDIGGAFASTYVHWYAISTGITSTAPAGLVSSNPPTVGPVAMPSSYSGWTYLGASPYTSASTTVSSTHRFVRNYAVFPRPQDNEIVTAGASTSIAAVSISSAIPPNSPGYHLRISQSTAAASATVLIDGVSTYFSLSPTFVGTNLYVPKTTDGLAYQMSAAGGALNILLTGYQMPNGDV